MAQVIIQYNYTTEEALKMALGKIVITPRGFAKCGLDQDISITQNCSKYKFLPSSHTY